MVIILTMKDKIVRGEGQSGWQLGPQGEIYGHLWA